MSYILNIFIPSHFFHRNFNTYIVSKECKDFSTNHLFYITGLIMPQKL